MVLDSHIIVPYSDFPIEEKAVFRRLCEKFGLHEEDFELKAEVESADLASWRVRPHVVIVHHLPSSRTRICAGWSKKTWLAIIEEYFYKHRLPKEAPAIKA